MKLIDKNGNFSIFLQMQIARYAMEFKKPIHEIINILKESGVPFKDWCYYSLSGYEGFKHKMDYLYERKN